MSSIINVSSIAPNKGQTFSMPGSVKERKVSSEHHFRTILETSDGALDRLITDQEWIDEIRAAWDNAPNVTTFNWEMDNIKAYCRSCFRNCKDKAGELLFPAKFQSWLTQGCFGLPGWCRDEEKATRKKGGRKKGEKNFLCPASERMR